MAPERKAPSEGTKVDLGRNAPVVQENAGFVDPESLAAESTREGGEFSDNKMHTENTTENVTTTTSSSSSSSNNNSRSTTEGQGPSQNQSSSSFADAAARAPQSSSSSTAAAASAGTAPSYVSSQYIRDPNGPHGRNIQEVSSFDDDDNDDGNNETKYRDGQKLAMEAEPGSINDPGRAAEMKFEQQQNAAAGGTGPRQGKLTTETAYDKLGSDVSS